MHKSVSDEKLQIPLIRTGLSTPSQAIANRARARPTNTHKYGQEGRRRWGGQQEGCWTSQKGRGCSQQEGGRGLQEGCSRRRRMVKGFEEGQRQKVSCPTMLPFHPTTQNGARPVPPIRVFSCGSIPPEQRPVGRRLTARETCHIQPAPSGPAYTLTPTFHSITREPPTPMIPMPPSRHTVFRRCSSVLTVPRSL